MSPTLPFPIRATICVVGRPSAAPRQAVSLLTNKTVLLTLGRLPKALELARGLHRAGCRVIVAEPFRWHVCGASRSVAKSIRLPSPNDDPTRYRDALVNVIEKESVDLVIPVSEEAIHAMAVADRLAPSVRVFSLPRNQLIALHDKLSFARTAAAAGLSVPTTFAVHEPAAQQLVDRHAVIVKPSHGCSGVGIQRLERGQRLPDLPGHIAQSLVEGRHISTFSVVHEGAVRVTAMYEGTLFSGTVAVCFRRVPQHDAVASWVERFVAAQGLSGFVSFDFIVDDEGTPWAIECNPRLTSGVHFLDHGDLAAAVLAPDQPRTIRFRERDHFQQFYPALTETYKFILRPRQFAHKFATLLRARDVVLSARDPLPFLLMTPVSWPILRQTIFEGKSFGEAATDDIAWHGPASDGETGTLSAAQDGSSDAPPDAPAVVAAPKNRSVAPGAPE